MRTSFGILLFALTSSLAIAQQGVTAAPAPAPGQRFEKKVMIHGGGLGAWWKNSKIAEQIHLTDAQTKQLEDAFYQHRLRLIDYGAEMEKADMKLQQMLDSDDADDSSVNAQVDQVLAARGKMEREFTIMNLNFRKILTPTQWKQLRSMRGNMHDRMFFRQGLTPGGPGPNTAPLPPGPQGELLDPALFPPDEAGECSVTEKNGMHIVNCTKNIEIIKDMKHEL